MPYHPHNWYPKEHQDALERAVTRTEIPAGAIVEVGSFEGQSTNLLADLFLRPILCVDPWGDQTAGADRSDPGAAAAYTQFVSNLGRSAIRFRCGWEQFFTVFDGPLAFLHIDAVHEYDHVRRNIEAALPCAVPGAVFCGHDYCDLWPGVQQAVDQMFPDRTVDQWVWSAKL